MDDYNEHTELQWYLLRATAQLDVKIALFVNRFVVYHLNEPVVSSHLQCTAAYEVAAHRRDHCTHTHQIHTHTCSLHTNTYTYIKVYSIITVEIAVTSVAQIFFQIY